MPSNSAKISGLEVDGNDGNVPPHLTCERPFITWWGGARLPNISALIYLGMILLLLLFYCTKKTTCFYLPSSQLLFYNIYFFFPVKKIVHVHCRKFDLKKELGTSLVVQWLRICLPLEGTWVWALVWEDSTCRRATKPVCHNYWAQALEPASHNYWARAPRAHAPQQEKPPQWEVGSLKRRVAPAHCN